MYLLAIETTGAFASAALLRGPDAGAPKAGGPVEGAQPEVLDVIHGNDRYSHLQNLTPQIEQLLTQNGLTIGDMTAIAVSNGPGSFTGIRIGVSTARALAQILGIPCIAVSSLEALALRASDSAAGTLLCPALDARRKQVYGAAYEIVDGKPVCRIEPSSCLMTEFLQKLDDYAAGQTKSGRTDAPALQFLGDGVDTCGEILEEWEKGGPAFAEVETVPLELRYQDAAAVALRGWQLYTEGRTCGYMDLQPEYLRMAEAEKKLRDKMAAEQVQGS